MGDLGGAGGVTLGFAVRVTEGAVTTRNRTESGSSSGLGDGHETLTAERNLCKELSYVSGFPTVEHGFVIPRLCQATAQQPQGTFWPKSIHRLLSCPAGLGLSPLGTGQQPSIFCFLITGSAVLTGSSGR